VIVNLCDACGRKTHGGMNIPEQRVILEPDSQTKRHARDHSGSRQIRVRVLLGLDDINPEPEHPGHDLCDPCRVLVLRSVIEDLEEN